tara:strand:- start:245 stop:478 length:234 start_codon:yes stop_codon:yes gene_type:complete
VGFVYPHSKESTEGVVLMSRIEDEVCKKIQDRAAVGLRKYGVTMERTDFSKKDWLTYLQEELMDAVVYVQRLIEEEE